MTRQKFPCKNHSDKLSAKRCFVCKDYICSDCQKKWSHHIFCGYYCYIKFQSFDYKKFILSNLRIIIIFLFFQMLTIIFIMQFYSNDVQDIEPYSNDLYSTAISEDLVNIFTLDTMSIPNENYLQLSGKTSNNSLLGLWHNGELKQSLISTNENYKFDPLMLYFGDNIFKVLRIDSYGKTVLIDSIQLNYYSKRVSYLMKSVSKIRTDKLVLSLTFDGGSITTGADSILKILELNNIKTTFFLTGKFINRNPALTKKILKAGHEIGNHSFSHPHLTQFANTNEHNTLEGVNRSIVQLELLKTDSVFYANFRQNMIQFWRAPFGEYNKEILQWAAEIGYKHIRWSKNCDLLDWVIEKESTLYKTPEEMYNKIMDLDQKDELKGSILLMHFGTDRKTDIPYKMLPKLIKNLKGKNYELIKISELLKLQISS